MATANRYSLTRNARQGILVLALLGLTLGAPALSHAQRYATYVGFESNIYMRPGETRTVRVVGNRVSWLGDIWPLYDRVKVFRQEGNRWVYRFDLHLGSSGAPPRTGVASFSFRAGSSQTPRTVRYKIVYEGSSSNAPSVGYGTVYIRP